MSDKDYLCPTCECASLDWCSITASVNRAVKTCDLYRPKATEESNSSSMACSIQQQEQATVITMFLTKMQTIGAWPCILEVGEDPQPMPPEEVFRLLDEFVGRN